MTSVLLAGAVANKHGRGGSISVRMSWAESLRQLGFDVVLVDELYPGGDAAAFAAVVRELGLAGALLDGDRVRGMDAHELVDRVDAAALLVNLGGHLRRPELLRRVRRRAYIDLDPGYTQIWQAEGRRIGVEDHHVYLTVGANVGTSRCPLPTAGIRWIPIRQPVVLERWPLAPGGFSSFTSVASWRGAYGPVAWAGRTYGVKAHEFRRVADLPRATGLPFELALDLHSADALDRERLVRAGWRLHHPATVATPDSFARFVRSSGAEFSVAQGVYVETRSGWLSDRTVRYLASGRPALVQETGLAATLPVGEGLLTFGTPAEAASQAKRLVAEYGDHARAARRLAEQLFAPEPALAPLLAATGVAP